MRKELKHHPDQKFVKYLCDGLKNGFDTLISALPSDNKICKNLMSAQSQPEEVDKLIEKELFNEFIEGPFKSPPFHNFRVSPIGIAERKYSGKKRLIIDLSSPHDTGREDVKTCNSINSLIDKDMCSLTYVKIDDAIRHIKNKGRGAILCKTDICNAFKLLPIRPDQMPFFMIKWRDSYYVSTRLAFGCRSSPKIFDNLSRAICWIAENNYDIPIILHLLDDFLTVQSPNSDGDRTMSLLTLIFNKLKVPISVAKTEGPTTVIEYLGVILDSDKMEARLPTDKVNRIIEFIQWILSKKSCTKRELLQLLGHFNFASRVIMPGRSFVSYLINVSTSVRELHHFVHLSKEGKEDLFMWLEFLKGWNGVSMFYEDKFTTSEEFRLFTDASSTLGFSAFFQNNWFCAHWPDIIDKDSSMAFRELYPIVAASVLWGEHWRCKQLVFMCDNEATVNILNKGRSKCLNIMNLMRKMTWLAAVNNFTFKAKHIPGKYNIIADSLSRFQMKRFREAAPEANLSPDPCPKASDIFWSRTWKRQ